MGEVLGYRRGVSPLAAIAIVIAAVLAMEGVAWASHKYVMHGFADRKSVV